MNPLIELADTYANIRGINPHSFQHTALAQFSRWVRTHTYSGSLFDIRRVDVIDWITYASTLGWDNAQRLEAQKTILDFFVWMKTQGMNPPPISAQDFRKIQVWHDRMVPNAKAIEQMFATHRDLAGVLSRFDWHRQDVLLRLLYDLTLQPDSIPELTTRHLNVKTGFLHVEHTGQTLPLDKQTVTAFHRWLTVRAAHVSTKEPALLVTRKGHPINRNTVMTVIRKLAEYADVHVDAHQIRVASLVYDTVIGERKPKGILNHEREQVQVMASRINQDQKTLILQDIITSARTTGGEELTYDQSKDTLGARTAFRLRHKEQNDEV